jgi:hypothetical protein
MSGALGAGLTVEIANARCAGYHLSSSLRIFFSQFSLAPSIWFPTQQPLFGFFFFLGEGLPCPRTCPDPASNQPTYTRNETFFFQQFFLLSFSLMVEALLECMRGRRRVHFSDVESPRGHDDEDDFFRVSLPLESLLERRAAARTHV